MSEEVNSIEELVAGGISELQTLVDKGNTVAGEWLQIIQQQDNAMSKLAVFGEMRVTLRSSLPLSDEEKEKEVRQVYDAMWPQTELKSPGTALEPPSIGTYGSSSITWKEVKE